MNILDGLLTRLHTELDSKGRAHADCPFCGHEISRRGYHFYLYESSFGRGYVCWSCGARGSLRDLANHLAVIGDDLPSAPRIQKPQPIPPWTRPGAAQAYRQAASDRFERAVAAWQAYKPLSRATIERYGLSIGQLPLWADDAPRKPGHWYSYRYERLLVPLWHAGQIVGLVGRAIHPNDDGPKWLTASFSTLDHLYPAIAPRATLILCENRIDALLAMDADPRAQAVAIGGCRWRDEWTQQIAASRPNHVLIWLDHDLSGNGSRYHERELQTVWRARIAERRANNAHLAARPWPNPPEPIAPRIANALLSVGVPASLYVWPRGTPAKADLGWALAQTMRKAAA